jgi:hypothetical protein
MRDSVEGQTGNGLTISDGAVVLKEKTRPVLTFESARGRRKEMETNDLNISFNYHSKLECSKKIYG